MTLSSAVETFEQLALDEVFVWDMFSIEIVNDWKINIGNDYITTGYNEYKQHKLYIYIWTHVKIQSFPKTPLASVQVAVKLLKGKMTIFGEGVSRPALFYTLAACYFLDDQIRSTFLCSVGGTMGNPHSYVGEVYWTKKRRKRVEHLQKTCRIFVDSEFWLYFFGFNKTISMKPSLHPGTGNRARYQPFSPLTWTVGWKIL